MNKITLVAGFGAITLLSACMTPKDFETAPIKISTPQGEVVCQLYQTNMTDWDRATSWPNALTSQQADALCLAEGKKRL